MSVSIIAMHNKSEYVRAKNNIGNAIMEIEKARGWLAEHASDSELILTAFNSLNECEVSLVNIGGMLVEAIEQLNDPEGAAYCRFCGKKHADYNKNCIA